MIKPLSRVAALVLFVCLSLSLHAQQVVPGMIVVVKSSSGKYLSALANETLGLMPNRALWEQWEVVQPTYKGLHLRSYQGTALLIEFDKAYHAPFGEGDNNTMGGVNVFQFQGHPYAQFQNAIVNGGFAFIGGTPGRYLAESPSGALFGVSADGSGNEQVPANARWTVEIVPNPSAGRQRPQEAVYARSAYKLRSAHNTLLDTTDGGAGVSTAVIADAGGKIFTVTTLDRYRDWAPLRFGDSSQFTASGRSMGYTLAPGANDTLVWLPLQPQPVYWKIMPTGAFKVGDRVPMGATVLVQGPGAKNIGVTPEGKTYLHTNAALWESLTFSK